MKKTWDQIKVAVISGVIVLIVTLLCTWVIDWSKAKIHEGTIQIYKDSVTTISRKLNDSVSVLVTERRVFSQTLEKAKIDNRILASRVNSDIRSRNIVSTMGVTANISTDRLFNFEKDSTELYKTAYHDLYRSIEASYNEETKEMKMTDSIRVPIEQLVYLQKLDYKNYTGIKKAWKWVFEKKKLTQRIYNPNKDVKLEYPELIQIEK